MTSTLRHISYCQIKSKEIYGTLVALAPNFRSAAQSGNVPWGKTLINLLSLTLQETDFINVTRFMVGRPPSSSAYSSVEVLFWKFQFYNQLILHFLKISQHLQNDAQHYQNTISAFHFTIIFNYQKILRCTCFPTGWTYLHYESVHSSSGTLIDIFRRI